MSPTYNFISSPPLSLFHILSVPHFQPNDILYLAHHFIHLSLSLSSYLPLSISVSSYLPPLSLPLFLLLGCLNFSVFLSDASLSLFYFPASLSFSLASLSRHFLSLSFSCYSATLFSPFFRFLPVFSSSFLTFCPLSPSFLCLSLHLFLLNTPSFIVLSQIPR